MIDINLPIEFEDGTPIELVPSRLGDISGGSFTVLIPKGLVFETNGSPAPFPTTYWYHTEDGRFGGSQPGNTRYKLVRNVEASTEPEDWS